MIEVIKHAIQGASVNSIRFVGFGLSASTCLILFTRRPENITPVIGLVDAIFPAASVFTIVDYVREEQMAVYFTKLKRGQDDDLHLVTVWLIPIVSLILLLSILFDHK